MVTLTGVPVAGWSSQGQGVSNSSGTIITDFDPAVYGPGNHNITYPMDVPIPYTSSILVNGSNILSSNVTINNPSCFGFNDGSAISYKYIAITPNWLVKPLLSAVHLIHNNDNNGCVFSNSVIFMTL